jgi:autotransporter-associated beta strand protein
LTSNVTFALNGTPVDAFTGDVIGLRATLAVNRNLSVNGLADGSTASQPGNNATVTIGAGSTLTVGNSGGGGTWSRPIGGAGSFAKIGAGTESLTGVNTYAGDTSVSGGTLSITNSYLANAADVHVDTGGILDLSFAGTDTIDQLFLNGAAQAAGVWGSATSGAPNVSALLSGSGTLTVTTGAVVGVPGDFNNDGHVDAADYASIRKQFSDLTTGGGLTAYTAWRQHFGNPPGAGSGLSNAAVPEPTTIGLVLMGLAAFGLGRRSR